MNNYTLINEETGELINITEQISFNYNSNLSKQVINQMLQDNSIKWLEINGY